MRKFKNGWALTKKSWGILRSRRELLRFPLYGGLAMLPLAIVMLGPGFYLIEDEQTVAGAAICVLGIYLLAFVGLFFSVGLAATADRIFRGEQASVGDGLAVARSRWRQVAGWAAVVTVVRTIVGFVQSKDGMVGNVLGNMLLAGWAVITFLAVPVIAFEGSGPLKTLRRSGSLFRQRWGEQATGNVAIGGAAVLFGVLPALLMIAGGIYVWLSVGAGGAALVLLGVAVLAVALLVRHALSGIFGVALYRYASDGQALGGFTEGDLASVAAGTGGRVAPAGSPVSGPSGVV